MVNGYKAIGMIAGVPVIISDTLPVDNVNGYYTAFLFAKEPVGIAYKRDIMIESDRDILNRTTVTNSNNALRSQTFTRLERTSKSCENHNK